MISISKIDLLILDEPTNNLDIETIEVITESLKTFKGAIIVISHDMNFLNEMEIDKYYEIKNHSLIANGKWPIANLLIDRLI